MSAEDGRVVSNFIVQALRHEDISIYGQGQQTRSFCYVDDLIDGLIALMASPSDFTGPVNLGNPNEFTISELAKFVLEEVSSASTMTFHELPQDDPQQRRPDISLAEQHLGWKPTVSLRHGLSRTVQYFREQMAQ